MKMQHTYGIFDHEADAIIELVRRHAPLAQIHGTECPACGSAMAVEFFEGGTSYQVFCHGDPLHISTHQEVTHPPPWWHECALPPTNSTWYWREWHAFDNSGALTMKVSGWRADDVRWSGQIVCGPEHPDHAFWRWVLSDSGCTLELINETELADLRERFANAGSSRRYP